MVNRYTVPGISRSTSRAVKHPSDLPVELGFERIPSLAEAGIKSMINGPFTFGPDGNQMTGPGPGTKSYRAAVGVKNFL